MPLLDLLHGVYHKNDCDHVERGTRRDVKVVGEGIVESGFYPKCADCFEKEAGDHVAEYINL